MRPQRPDDITSSDRIRHGSTGERRVLDGHIRPLYILPLSKPAGHSTPKIGPPPTCAHTVTEFGMVMKLHTVIKLQTSPYLIAHNFSKY